MNELEQNQAIADAICRDFRWQGRDFQLGQCLALLDGSILAVAPNLDQALKALRAVEPDPNRGMIVEVAKPVLDVIR